jgi:WD40 repeat protein
MRLVKDRTAKEVSQSEIGTISYDYRKKLIAVGAFEEPVLIYRYPYMKLFKKITHREKIPLTEEELLTTDEKSIVEIKGTKFRKGKILSPIKILFSKTSPHLLVAYTNGDILIYNIQTWKKQTELFLPESITSVQLANKGKFLFLITSWEITIIDTLTWKIIKTKKLEDIQIQSAILTENSETLFIISDKKRVRSFNFETLEEENVFKGHKSGINMIRLSPDEKILATCGNDGKISLFNAKNGEFVGHLLGHADEVHAIDFSSNCKFLVSSSEDETIRLWDVSTFKCVKIIQNIPNAFTMKIYKDLLVMGTVSGDIFTFRIY